MASASATIGGTAIFLQQIVILESGTRCAHGSQSRCGAANGTDLSILASAGEDRAVLAPEDGGGVPQRWLCRVLLQGGSLPLYAVPHSPVLCLENV
jgi:hypothetical protein